MYEAEISRKNPGLFLFMVDQSGSMGDMVLQDGFEGKSLAKNVADVINKLLYELVLKCTKDEGIRDYFYVGVIAYGENGVSNGFKNVLSNNYVNPVSMIGDNPAFIEERSKKMSDGAGGLLERKIKFPVWFKDVANGGTPMRAAFIKAAEVVGEWCENHHDGFPPIIINITDGESTDGDPEEIADRIKKMSTNDGNALIFNIHTTAGTNTPLEYCYSDSSLYNDNVKKLFHMSSILPLKMQTAARSEGKNINEKSRGYVYNADMISLITFLDIGTRVSQNLR